MTTEKPLNIMDYCVQYVNTQTNEFKVLYAGNSVADCANWLQENHKGFLEYGDKYIIAARFC